MAEHVNTVVVGGGQAGLSMSYHLQQKGIDHVVLEAAALPADAWRNRRWDSFTLVTPNWHIRLPGAEYAGADPDGYLPRQEIVAYFENWIERCRFPIQYQARATAVLPRPGGPGYRVETTRGDWEAHNVVIATGAFQADRAPAFRAGLPEGIFQLLTSEYRRPEQIPPGAVLVVGTGQSGCQIAQELYQGGRQVYLSVGGAPRAPRRYRGKDIVHWLVQTGFFEETIDQMPSPLARFAPNPQVSGKDGGQSLNLHQFARDGVRLLGRIRGAQGGRVQIAPDLHDSLAKADRFEAELLQKIDGLIDSRGLDAPPETLPVFTDGFAVPQLESLDLQAAGITAVIWACGFNFDYSLVRLPVLGERGFPLQTRGVTAFPGLYFLGLSWMHTRKSPLLNGVGEDAAYLAEQICA